MLLKPILTLVFFLFISIWLNAQNILKSESTGLRQDFTVNVNVEYKQLYQNTPFEIKPLVDPEVNNSRPKDTLDYYSPFMHSALYIGIGAKVNYKNKYKLGFKLFAEQRNWSLGVNSSFTYKVFSEFALNINDTIEVKKDRIPIRISMGDMYLKDEYVSGLRAFNIDLQGLIANVEYKRLNLNMLYISDMAGHVGLNINEYMSIKFSRKFSIKRSLNKPLVIGLSCDYALLTKYYSGPEKEQFSYGLFANLIINEGVKLSIISDYYPEMNNNLTNGFDNNIALLAKLSYKYSNKKSLIAITPKFRYYGKYYRMGNYDTISSHTRTTYRYHYSNQIVDGAYLYPLKNYYRPVSQYALYTEYRGDYNIFSFELEASWDWSIDKRFGNKIDVELISIHRNSTTNGNYYTYVYYTSFFYYNLFHGFKAGILISNKQMNRDVSYQTFYQMKYPFFGFHFTYNGAFEFNSKENH